MTDRPAKHDDTSDPWWRHALLYQVYIRSFADSNDDGVGDLLGVVAHLDYLQWLGVDGIWLSPVTPSPDVDWGYDVADYCAVHPVLGTMADLDTLVAEARRRRIRVLLDLVPNHTSAHHPWFVAARSSRTDPRRHWYVWADPAPDGGPPNNWASGCGGPAWTLDAATGQYYLHNHLPEQPDLNWWNEDVAGAFDDVLRFWFDRGVAGFRIDVCNLIIKDAQLRDNPPATEDDELDVQLLGQRTVFNGNRPEVHEVLRRWHLLARSVGEARVLLGETPVPIEELARYYGDGDELDLAFNFPLISAPFEASALRRVVADTERLLPTGAWPAWTGSNHDFSRLASRWAGGDERKTRLALIMLLCLRGTPVLYQGDEIGLEDGVLERRHLRDPLGVRYWPAYAGRDAGRTPMPWRAGPGGGFSSPTVVPWLPMADTARRNVADQRRDPASVLTLVHDLVALRRATPDLRLGPYRLVTAPEGVWAWQRGAQTTVVLNLADDAVDTPVTSGRVVISSTRRRDDEEVEEALRLGPWEGVVIGHPSSDAESAASSHRRATAP